MRVRWRPQATIQARSLNPAIITTGGLKNCKVLVPLTWLPVCTSVPRWKERTRKSQFSGPTLLKPSLRGSPARNPRPPCSPKPGWKTLKKKPDTALTPRQPRWDKTCKVTKDLRLQDVQGRDQRLQSGSEEEGTVASGGEQEGMSGRRPKTGEANGEKDTTAQPEVDGNQVEEETHHWRYLQDRTRQKLLTPGAKIGGCHPRKPQSPPQL
ncbi:hypothetical protein NDU88_001941 [Pleurodeles waltl]|uniref:Uncharacterized protein n=1 Tax=Pleurodeles waltl TaxID=8319 RepID=A0AAV7Q7I2_PLEWA|nr:hypothetical protein NDU88_001941 [Pleurodeles waltl]